MDNVTAEGSSHRHPAFLVCDLELVEVPAYLGNKLYGIRFFNGDDTQDVVLSPYWVRQLCAALAGAMANDEAEAAPMHRVPDATSGPDETETTGRS